MIHGSRTLDDQGEKMQLTSETITRVVIILANSYITDLRSINFIAKKLREGISTGAFESDDVLDEFKTYAYELAENASSCLMSLANVRDDIGEEGWSSIILEYPGLMKLEDDLSRIKALNEMAKAGLALPTGAESEAIFQFGEVVSD